VGLHPYQKKIGINASPHFIPYKRGWIHMKQTEDDIEFAKKIYFFVKQRERGLNMLNRYLEEGIEVPIMKSNRYKTTSFNLEKTSKRL
jgi:hypothetical protein